MVTLTLIDLKPRYEKKRVSFTFASISKTPSLLLIVPTTEFRLITWTFEIGLESESFSITPMTFSCDWDNWKKIGGNFVYP